MAITAIEADYHVLANLAPNRANYHESSKLANKSTLIQS
jgi:hypothetical protein